MRLIVILFLLLGTTRANANEPTDRRAAISLWVRGNQIYQEAAELENRQAFARARERYTAAAREYAKSADLFELEEVLYNLAQAKRKAGLIESALFTYKYLLTRYPETIRAQAATRYVFDLESLIRWSDERTAASRRITRRLP